MRINKHLGLRARRRGGLISLISICALLTLAPLFAGCSPQSMAQSATATAQAAASPSPSPAGTVATATAAVTPASTETPQAGATFTATITATLTVTATVVEGTPTPRPTPTGEPPPPINSLNVFNFFPETGTLVKRDTLQLEKDGPDEVLITVSSPQEAITGTFSSAVAVLTYDTVYREWDVRWSSTSITGTASPLPAANRAGGVNGGDLLRTGTPILLLRTTTEDNRAHLAMWRWNTGTGNGDYLKMLPVGGGPEREAVFDADLDVNVADLNDDGVYEVVADNLAGVQVWKWDGSRYVPEGGSR
jgi:hypothetical protein